MDEDEVERDNRGKRERRVKYTEKHENRVVEIRKELEESDSYFYGLKVVQENYKNRYEQKLSYWFIYDVLKKNGMIHSNEQEKRKEKSKYMNYPQKKLAKLGKIVAAIDFIGPNYIEDQTEGVNFLSLKYLRPGKEGLVKRIEAQTTDEAIRVLTEIFQDNPIPDILKMDNDTALGANLPHERTIGRLPKFLLSIGTKPLYVARSSPWNNGNVEGHNSVFGKKFWQEVTFSNEKEIDVKIKEFNMEYEQYCDLVNNNPEVSNPRYLQQSDLDNYNSNKTNYKEDTIYFLRIVRRKGEKGKDSEQGYIDILKQDINIDKSHINTFTFNKLNLKENKLMIGIQKEDKMEWIKTKKFKLKNVPSLNQS